MIMRNEIDLTELQKQREEAYKNIKIRAGHVEQEIEDNGNHIPRID